MNAIGALINRLIPQPLYPSIARAVREFGSAIAQATNLDTLVTAVIASTAEVTRTGQSCMILLNSTYKLKDAVELLTRYPHHTMDQSTHPLSLHSPLYRAWAIEQRATSYQMIQSNSEFRALATADRDFLSKLDMAAFAPIVLENTVIGLLACAKKSDGTPTLPQDLELLLVLAHQTGTAIRNARIMDDLRHLNQSMQSLNQNLKKSNSQLNQLDATKTDFITIASHELRTPLAQIRGYTDIINSLSEQGMLDQGQTHTWINKLSSAVDRMEELIAAMLDVSQLDVDSMALHFTETPVEGVVRMAIEPLSEAITQRKIRVSSHGLRLIPVIQADLQRLVQAFRNIIVNAVKFTPDGGRIEIRAHTEENEQSQATDWVLISITDSGIGIESKYLDAIFKKFFRAADPMLHSTGATKFLGAGPGLGLTIARGVIEAHGGAVWAESAGYDIENYPGTTIWIRLPVNIPVDARRVMTIEGDSASASVRQTDEFRALIRDQLANHSD